MVLTTGSAFGLYCSLGFNDDNSKMYPYSVECKS